MTLRIARWDLARIAASMNGALQGPPDARVGFVSTDSRNIRDGALFVALSGERFDGHDYVAAAAELGAAAAVVSRRVDVDLPQIVVDDTLRALQSLGAALFDEAQQDGVFSIALTGSNGKTTTKELLAALWGTLGVVHATRGNFNNHIGVPLTLCEIPVEAQFLVIEMGANGPDDIGELVALAPADVRVITSIGAAHIEGFGGLDGVRRAKSQIFHHATAETLAVVPETEPALVADFPGKIAVVGSSLGRGRPARASQPSLLRYSRDADQLEVTGNDFELHLKSPLPGDHNAHNLATAVATIYGTGRQLDERLANEALASLQLPGGRWRRVSAHGYTFLDDAYNANPSSVRASWDAFVEIQQSEGAVGDVVAVIGEMFELGAEAEAMHRETAEWVARRGGADHFAFVGSFANQMAESAAQVTNLPVHAFAQPSDAAQWLLERGPCTVYLKASRGQRLEAIIELVTDNAQ